MVSLIACALLLTGSVFAAPKGTIRDACGSPFDDIALCGNFYNDKGGRAKNAATTVSFNGKFLLAVFTAWCFGTALQTNARMLSVCVCLCSFFLLTTSSAYAAPLTVERDACGSPFDDPKICLHYQPGHSDNCATSIQTNTFLTGIFLAYFISDLVKRTRRTITIPGILAIGTGLFLWTDVALAASVSGVECAPQLSRFLSHIESLTMLVSFMTLWVHGQLSTTRGAVPFLMVLIGGGTLLLGENIT